ncbi:beta strand repeat-containing protein, partial [Tenacibaculum litopenaei]|uniref:beta strand repeat-containing protein n=1 Tax=Tenacibaculum litopenaei TaxID=396016 RepID=UPI0038B5E316
MKRLLLVSIALCLYTFNALAQDKSLENRVKGDPDKKIEYKESLVKSRPDVPFTQRLGAGGLNVRGNMTFIANNIMNREYTTIYRRSSSAQWQLDNCGDWYWDYVYTAAGSLDANDSHPSSPTRYYRRSTDACNRHYYSNINTLNNGQANMQYIDIDNADGIPGSGSTFSSSRSTLALPNCSRVVFAGLYWAGVYPYEDFATQTARDAVALRSIKFKIPGNANYVDLTASTVTADKEVYDNNSDGAYVCFKDVTAMVAGQANANGNYYVANVKGARGIDNLRGIGGSAGWTLVIIYENQNESSKNISIFDGFVSVNGSSSQDISYSGFKTIPAGPVRAEIMAATLEGDGYISGDRFQIRNKVGTYEDISNAVNPANNFFNGSITRNNNHTTTRNPQSTNTLGFDMDHVVLNNPSNSIIGNGDTSANIRFTTGGDVYWPFLNALSVEIIEPELQLIKTIDDGAGNDLSGQTVALGSELWYNISFQNVGTDNALNAEIVDLLPKNVDLVAGDLQLPAGIPASNATYVAPSLANGFRGRLTIQIPDSMVQENGAKYNIRFKVKVAATCNDLRDVCSNVVQNQAFANYDSDRGGLPRKINEPSFAGLDACNFGIVGTSNFLADTSGCTFTRDEVLCGSSITLTAGAGFASYEWRNGAGTVIGNTQSITVNATGTYTVNKVAPVGCINATETINVIPYTTQPNPLIPFADRMLTCPSDGSDLAEMYLCGVGGSRSINLPITPGSGTTVRWFKLDETSCPDETTAGCANKNTSCTWNEVSTALTYNVTDAGEYKVEVLYDGRCPSEYFFNVFKATLNPDIVKTDITCGNNGQIIINNVPAGYQYSLSGPGGYFVDFQNSNTFTVTNPGDYNLRIRINNPTAASCVYDFGPINIRDLSIALDVTTTNILCAGDRGRIRVRVNNVPGQYTYTLLQGATTVATQGPINSNDYTFEVSTGGNYTVRVATPSCNTTQDVVITQAPALTLTAAATKNISCTAGSSAGIINLTAAGGTLTTGAQYTFAVWTDKGTDLYTNVADIPSSAYFTNTTYNVTNGNQGTYRFVVVDSNNCATISNPVTITVEPPLAFNHTANDVSCVGNSDGSIAVSVNGSNQGYTVEYSIDGGTSWNTTGNFTGLAPGSYDINIRATKTSYQCLYTIDKVLINNKTAITGSASLTQNYTCTQQGEITFAAASGGTAPYSYGIDGVYSTNRVKGGLTQGTYALTIRDANNCVLTLSNITIDPLPTAPTLAATIAYSCTGAGNVTITPLSAGYTYSLDGATPVTTNVFTNVSVGNHTVTVNYGRNCTRNVSFNVAANQAFTGTVVGSTNSVCHSADNGTITISASNFVGGDYEYSIDGGANWLTAVDNPSRIVGVPDGTHNIRIRETFGGATCVVDLGNVTITEPPQLNLTATVTSNPSCTGTTTGATVTAVATGGTPPYTYSIDGGLTWQSSGVFTNVAPSATDYIINVRDSRNCDECGCTVDPFVNGGFELPTTTGRRYRSLHEDQVPGWDTTASDNRIEIWSNGFNGVTASEGVSFAELNANAVSTLYQEYCTQPGDIISWSLDHRGRAGTDVANVKIGGDLGSATVQRTMTDGNTAWGSYSGTYTVPAGQSTTVIAFEAVSTATGSLTVGNFIDNVNIRITKVTCTPVRVTVNPPAPVTHTATVTNCYDGTNGQIAVNVTQGVQNYLFRINGGAWVAPTPATATSHTFTGLTPGAYTIEVQDALGCVSTASNHRLDDTLTATTAVTNITCNPGSITINATGGDGNYRYAAVPTGGTPTFGTSNTIAATAPGVYDIYVRDNSGNAGYCEFRDNVTVRAIANPVATLTPSQPNCNGDTGSISVAITQGVGPYTVRMTATTAGTTTTVGPSASTTAVFNTLGADTYTFVVTDANGCTSAAVSETITVPTTITGSASLTENYTCTQQGEITFAIAGGGTAPYSYGIDGVYSTNRVKTGLTEGTYVLTIRDANNCVRTLPSITIDRLPTLPAFTPAVAYNCTGSGNITITPTGAGYTYSLDGAPAVTTNVFNNVAVGPHTVTINYGRSCTTNVAVTVLANQQFAASITGSTNSTCNGADNGTITIAASNFGASFDYTVNGGTNWINATSSPVTVNNVPDGVNNVRVRISAGVCELDLGNVTITEPAAVGVTATITSPANCTATPGATITAVATGGTAPYEYSINGGTTWQSSGVFTNVAASGTAYTIQARDSRNCASTSNATITVNPPSTVTHTATVTNCYDGTNGQIVVTAANGVQNYLFRINGGAWVNASPATSTSHTFTGLTPGAYTIQVQDALGCVSTVSNH